MPLLSKQNKAKTSYTYFRPRIAVAVSADVPANNGVRTSAVTVMTKMLDICKFFLNVERNGWHVSFDIQRLWLFIHAEIKS